MSLMLVAGWRNRGPHGPRPTLFSRGSGPSTFTSYVDVLKSV